VLPCKKTLEVWILWTTSSIRSGGAVLKRCDEALCTSASRTLIDVMNEARLLRFGAGKAHLGAAFHATRLLVEALGFVLWHTPKPRHLGAGPRVPPSISSGKQPELALHRSDTPFASSFYKHPVRPLPDPPCRRRGTILSASSSVVMAVRAVGKVGNPKLSCRPASRRLACTSCKDIACGAFFQGAFGGDQIRFACHSARRFAHGFGHHSAHHFGPERVRRSAAL
jgi:hypothetical protein